MHKILILGGGGFTGKHFVQYIIKKKLVEKFHFYLTGHSLAGKTNSPGINYIEADLVTKNDVKTLICRLKPNYIINLIGELKAPVFEMFMFKNFTISRYIFESIIECGITVKNILLIGSAAEYGKHEQLPLTEETPPHPLTPYGLTKYFQTTLATFYFENYGIASNVARTFNLMGADLSEKLAYGSFAKQINNAKNGDTILVGNLHAKRDYIQIEQAVEYYWKILLFGKPGEIYNVCSGVPVTIETLLKRLIRKSNKKLAIQINPEFLQKQDVDNNYGSPAKLVALIAACASNHTELE